MGRPLPRRARDQPGEGTNASLRQNVQADFDISTCRLTLTRAIDESWTSRIGKRPIGSHMEGRHRREGVDVSPRVACPDFERRHASKLEAGATHDREHPPRPWT